MSYITRNLRQRVTYWSPGVPDGTGGFTYSAPITIKGRWEERSTLFTDAAGEQNVSSTRVYVDTDVVENGYLFLGESEVANPTAVVDSHRILDFRRLPNLQATKFERRALL